VESFLRLWKLGWLGNELIWMSLSVSCGMFVLWMSVSTLSSCSWLYRLCSN